MSNIVVIGEPDSVLPFMGLGLETCPITKPGDATKQLKTILKSGLAKVIFITEGFYEETHILVDDLKKRSFFPSVIYIPGNRGSRGLGLNKIRKVIERAVGVDLLFKE